MAFWVTLGRVHQTCWSILATLHCSLHPALPEPGSPVQSRRGKGHSNDSSGGLHALVSSSLSLLNSVKLSSKEPRNTKYLSSDRRSNFYSNKCSCELKRVTNPTLGIWDGAMLKSSSQALDGNCVASFLLVIFFILSFFCSITHSCKTKHACKKSRGTMRDTPTFMVGWLNACKYFHACFWLGQLRKYINFVTAGSEPERNLANFTSEGSQDWSVTPFKNLESTKLARCVIYDFLNFKWTDIGLCLRMRRVGWW